MRSLLLTACRRPVQVRGYAWSGGGQPIARVDVSADGGASWLVADIVGQESRVRLRTALFGIAWNDC